MSARRTLIIIVALAVGAVAAIVTVLYVNSAQSRANNNAKLVAVYVISRDIPKNSTGDSAISNGAIQRSSIPRKFYPNTAVTNVSEIKGKITPTELVPGQILVENEFVEPSVASTSFSGTELQAGEVAITVTLPPANAAGGLVVPGDLIDLLRITTPQAAGAAAGSGTTNPATSIAHFFYQNVKVIAIGAQAAPTPGQTQTPTAGASALFTLAVPPEAAERILLAASQGTIFAALVPPNNQPVNIPAVQGQNVDSTNPVLAGPPALTPEGSS